jgi:hypothetical protein
MSVLVAVQARRRGYRFLTWFFAGMLGNPIFFLILLAIMPDFARKALRQEEMADLEARLAARKMPAPPAYPLLAVPHPAGDASTLSAGRSLGDQPTIMPPLRSLGDEETTG